MALPLNLLLMFDFFGEAFNGVGRIDSEADFEPSTRRTVTVMFRHIRMLLPNRRVTMSVAPPWLYD